MLPQRVWSTIMKRDPAKLSNSPLAPSAKCKIRRAVIGTMLAGGALGIVGMTAQAHGNASSHSKLSLDWNFDNFVVNRESLINPGTAGIDPIVTLDREVRDAVSARDALRALSERPDEPLSNRMQNLGRSRLMNERALGLDLTLKQATTQRALTPLSRNVLSQLQANNPAGAVTLIERSGTPEEVLGVYATVQLDLYNYGAVDGRSTLALANEIIRICDAAIAYLSANAPNDLPALGGFLHNLASAALPDIGDPTPAQFQAGRAAAERAIEIRRRTSDPVTTGIALYLAGVYSLKAREYERAEQQLRQSIQLLENTARVNDLAWSKAYLGLTRLAQGDAAGAALVNEARESFRRSGNQFGLQYLSSLNR